LQCAVARVAAAALLAKHWPAEGSRNQAFLALAGALARAGWSLDEASAVVRAIYRGIWCDEADLRQAESEVRATFVKCESGGEVTGLATLGEMLPQEVMKAVVQWLGLGTSVSGAVRAQEAWPELVRFDDVRLPEFPADALPAPLSEWTQAEAVATQTPPDLPGLLALAVAGSCIARRVDVQPRPGWTEPTNLFVAVVLEPGNRKSAVFADATDPLREYERELIESRRAEVARALCERRQKEHRLRKLERLAGEKGDTEAAQEAFRLAAELAAEPEPVLPRLIVSDCTAEKLGMLLEEQGGRVASLSAEGGVFDLMAGLYNKNAIPQLDVYLQGHSGDDLLVDRVSRKSIYVQRPALTCAYTVQPQVVRALADKEFFRGRGLLARFLYAAPRSLLGKRQIAPPPVPDELREAYRATILRLASIDGAYRLELNHKAEAMMRLWEAEVEAMLGDGGAMEAFRDWGGKLVGATVRIAGIMHTVEHGPTAPINADTLERAIRIARYAIPHAAHVFGMLSERGAVDDALVVWRWIARHGKREFSKREAYQALKWRFALVEMLDPPLRELTERGYIRPKTIERVGAGRPPSPMFEVNPEAIKNAPLPPAPANFGDFGEVFQGCENSQTEDYGLI
jgi:hypothetical protein